MGKRQFKDRLYEQFARIGRALASPHRLELLDLLAQGERSVEELATEASLTVANASQHLRILRQAEMITTRREGTRVFCRLAGPEVFTLWQTLRTTGERRLAEIDRVVTTFLADRAQLEAISPAELLRRLSDGEVTLLDVRPEREFLQGHIPGARSIPIEVLPARLAELPRTPPIVAYCRGPYCVYADEAVRQLAAAGISAARLSVGYPDWVAAGLPTYQPDASGAIEGVSA
jgi:rhodanese-related sulfurtransferase